MPQSISKNIRMYTEMPEGADTRPQVALWFYTLKAGEDIEDLELGVFTEVEMRQEGFLMVKVVDPWYRRSIQSSLGPTVSNLSRSSQGKVKTACTEFLLGLTVTDTCKQNCPSTFALPGK